MSRRMTSSCASRASSTLDPRLSTLNSHAHRLHHGRGRRHVLRQLSARQHAGRRAVGAGRRRGARADVHAAADRRDRMSASTACSSAASTFTCSRSRPLFRHTPWWLDRLLDHPGAAWNVLSRGAGSVDPTQLGDMTVSMLRGEAGHQRKELEKLVHWLLTEVKPDIVHLSNSMQIGMARMLRERVRPAGRLPAFGRGFVSRKAAAAALRRGPRDAARAGGRRRCVRRDQPLLRRFHGRLLAVDRARIHVIPHGLKLGRPRHARLEKRPDEPRVIGYLGAHLRRQRAAPVGRGVRTIGQRAPTCRRSCCTRPAISAQATDRILQTLEARAAAGPLAGRFKYFGELDRAQKIAFLQSLDVFSAPTVYRESKACPRWKRWPTPCRSCCPTTAAFPK